MSKCYKYDQAIPFYSSIDDVFMGRLAPSWHNKNTWDFSPVRVNTPHELGIKVSAAGWTAAYFSDKIKARKDEKKVRNDDIAAFIELLKKHGFSWDDKEQKCIRLKDQMTLEKKGDLTFIVTAPLKNQKDLCILLEELLRELYGEKEGTITPMHCKTTKLFDSHRQVENKNNCSLADAKGEKSYQHQQVNNDACYITIQEANSTFQMTPEAFNIFGNTEITGFEKKCVQVKKVASWAIWDEPSHGNYKSISGMKLHGMFSTGLEKVLPQLNPNIVLLGLNCSKIPCDADGAWQNFHLRELDDESKLTSTNRPGQWLRYACRNTMFWGAYMTDLFKSLTDPNSGNVVEHFKRNPQGLQMAAKSFAEEMKALYTLATDKTQPLVIICLGNAVYDYLTKGYKKGSNLFINALRQKFPGIQLIVSFAYHYSYPIRCGYTDEQSLIVYLKHYQEVQQIIEESVQDNNGENMHNNAIITKKPSKIVRLKQ